MLNIYKVNVFDIYLLSTYFTASWLNFPQYPLTAFVIPHAGLYINASDHFKVNIYSVQVDVFCSTFKIPGYKIHYKKQNTRLFT